MAVAKGTLGIVMATVGGRLIFTETMKFIPFIGQITSTLVGGTIAGTVVKYLALHILLLWVKWSVQVHLQQQVQLLVQFRQFYRLISLKLYQVPQR